ncbi:cell envelope biogenesis protein TolA [Serratia fonticola]|uniref:cell envelope biogenesis protein TolA n=1 Tax=Serratia fonticola TaxID=47917 RepID=UPI0008FD4B3C|nr:cell envelope biogenesis protein TolA [Serratia fonticola]OIX96259.1 cell envelope biogenesis protein TolA [Serratia fonticola]QCR60819.1 cell envelope biogenesis protein TolA [Serratia fonticola]
MSEATGLSIVIEPVNALAVFTQPDHIEQILQQVEEEVSAFVFDASTQKGRDAMGSLGLKVAKTKTYLDGLGKDLVDEYKEVPKKIDASRKLVRDRLDALKEKVLQPRLEWEAEQKRLKAEEEARLAAEAYNAMRDEADRMNAEFDAAAAAALAARIESDHELALLMNEKHDRDVAEAKAEAERQRIAHEEELKRLAAEQAKRDADAEIAAAAQREADAKAALEKAERDAKDAAERAEQQRIEAEAKAAREKQEAAEQAERDKQAAIEAEQRRAKEEADRIRLEAEQKEAARLAEEKRIADEADKRAKDVAHRKTVNNQALADLVAAGVPEDCAKKCITAIAKGEVSAIRITY